MIIFFAFVLLIDGECVMLLYFVLSCKLWSKWSWSKWSNSKSDEKKVLKIVYINNIYYLYILSLGEKNTFKNRV